MGIQGHMYKDLGDDIPAPATKALKIVNSSGVPLAYFDANGNLYLRGKAFIGAQPDTDGVYTVDPSKPEQGNNYHAIQDAIDAVPDHSVIVVVPGAYGRITFPEDRNLVVRSTDPTDWDVVHATIIQGSWSDHVVTFHGNETSDSAIMGFTITAGYASNGGLC